MRRKELKEIVFKVSEGMLEKLTDLLLWQFFLVGASFGKYGSRGVYEAFFEANQSLEEINYKVFKRAIDNLRRKNFLKWNKKLNSLEIEITREGKQRLAEILPMYREKRTWDKKLYLITYDIPEQKHFLRDLLREYLKKIGCVKLQASVWLTPYSPTMILSKFVKENRLGETILISDLGLEGTVGGEDIKSLVKRVYKLEALNRRYEEFIDKYAQVNYAKTEVGFVFNSILEDDPQLPFEILPKNWLGDKAYKLMQEKLSGIHFSSC